MIRVGAHLSNSASAGDNPRLQALSYGMDCFQIMCGANQTPYPSTIYQDRDYADGWRGFMAQHPEMFVVCHLPYVANIASCEQKKWEMARNSLIHYRRCGKALGLSAILVHSGTVRQGTGTREEGLANAVACIATALNEPGPPLIVENSPGSGLTLGKPLDLFRIVGHFDPQDLGICIDTTHAFVAGFDVRDPKMARAIEQKFRPYLRCVHLNEPDLGATLGSKRDRHATDPGEGEFGPAVFKMLVQTFKDYPLILEGWHGYNDQKDVFERVRQMGCDAT